MANLFKRAAVFTDLHLGNKSNSHQFITDCENYIAWFLDVVRTRECDCVIFLGDFHHNRNNINIQTMDASLKILQQLDDLNMPVYFITGNHDLYHKDKRTVSSVKYIQKFQNIQLINDQITTGDVTFVPWLIGEEYKNMKRVKSQYVMGHFELPHFKMNAMVEMPDHGELNTRDFDNVGLVFSGHFHKRQKKSNIHYIGNAFAHNYADAWDDDRGCMILEWGTEPEYLNWPGAPRYRTLTLAQMLDQPDLHLDYRTHARVQLDISISYEEATFIKEEMQKNYNVRELSLIPHKNETLLETGIQDVMFESVDQIVMSQIQNLDTKHYDQQLLMEIYNNL
jgi:DNA repair exonuclease SbcCD nuclease subunit